jgi:hypothetical protein
MDALYTLQFYGDLPVKAPHLCAGSRAYTSIDEALGWLADHVVLDDEDADTQDKFWFDPEDDRIVIWEIKPHENIAAVWHASGWHWPHDASDLSGGPLEQGCLPGDTMSLYTRASD